MGASASLFPITLTYLPTLDLMSLRPATHTAVAPTSPGSGTPAASHSQVGGHSKASLQREGSGQVLFIELLHSDCSWSRSLIGIRPKPQARGRRDYYKDVTMHCYFCLFLDPHLSLSKCS